MICSWKSQPHLFIFSPGAVKGQENGERLIIYHFNKEAEDNNRIIIIYNSLGLHDKVNKRDSTIVGYLYSKRN